MTMKLRRLPALALSFALGLLPLGGCAALESPHLGELSVARDGSVRGSMEVAGKGGNFNRNTGLNLTAGDNSTAALILVAILGVAMFFIYPVQRSLRLRREKAIFEHYDLIDKHKTAAPQQKES